METQACCIDIKTQVTQQLRKRVMKKEANEAQNSRQKLMALYYHTELLSCGEKFQYNRDNSEIHGFDLFLFFFF